MARKKNEVTVIEPPEVSEQVVERISEAHNDVVAQYDRAVALAGKLGYEGAVTVDALEGEIRFYQRRTVEAILETGKRLLVLRELTPHGEFMERVQALGFARRTAQRFMQAAVKTSKCANLAHLSKEVKSASAFLELVTHDDDADLEKLAELDDIERMSASQVRDRLRELQAEREATQKVLDIKNQRIDQLEAEKAGKSSMPPDEAERQLRVDFGVAADAAEHAIRHALHPAAAALFAHDAEHGKGSEHSAPLVAGYVMQLQQALNDLRTQFQLPAFQDYVPSWLPNLDAAGAAHGIHVANGNVNLADLAVDPLDKE